ncbi:hypothetical protein RJD38_20010 [Vibrio scophthalmi]|uniref:hypothetical protein n=1 Tax=Vibrio scophthalmi TaxID=45658 RepID=UPI00349F4B3E
MLRDYLYVTGLAFRDIAHERVLSLCMVCSLGAIFTPIIILLGLQQGIIGNMLDKLNSDPASRLVRPKFITHSPIPLDKLEVIQMEGTVFIPSETSHLLLDIKGMSEPVNVVPSSYSDPFVSHDSKVAPENTHWVAISESLSRKLNKSSGDSLTLLLRRTTTSGYPEEIPLDCIISDVVSKHMMPDIKVYLSDVVFNGIYQWRKGFAVPTLGLHGNRDSQFVPEYDGVLTGFVVKTPKDEDYRQMLAGKLPFSTMPRPYNDLMKQSSDTNWVLWQTVNSTVTNKDIEILNNALLNIGFAPQLIPFVKTLELKLVGDVDHIKWNIYALGQDESPHWNKDAKPILYIPVDDEEYVGEQSLILKTGIMGDTTLIPVVLQSSDKVPPGSIVASHHFSGLLRAAQRAGATYEKSSFSFTLNSANQIRYFRVYSASIENLESLVETVKQIGNELGITALREPVSRIHEVRKIRTLSDYMKRIYLLIAAISGVSTVFAVAASVYATVQRRKRDLAYLNMLGVDNNTIIFFPFIKSLILISGGIVLSFFAYWVFSYLASQWFVDLLGDTESLTRLKGEYVLGLVFIILVLGGFSSLVAGGFVSKIDCKRCIHE